ncbi:Sporulation protein YpeB [Caldibacillus thermoamylovorans]|uniref:Sporulation protein YpeB n=1 Tax=Caldibacillus thermoamylovorans TaxID=35841 RepID=A0A090IW44_9BACI|nr:germination protein YpeB [Caldibacillus thermoamylovorans]CEE01892.1 Sporulation protein YpeB [Caldibacillus thermoamylovorans]
MIRNILIGVLTVGIVGVGIWGYQEHKEKNAILINAENNYQRAFHELTYNIDILHDKIGTTLAMSSRTSLSPTLAEVWRITSEANNSVGQLPLTLLPFNKTEEFLSNIGDFSYKTAVRDLEKEPLTDEEYKTLQSLYSQAAEIQNELRKVQHLTLKNNLRWMDVEMAIASGREAADNTIIDGFKTVEKKVEGYSETDMGPIMTSMEEKESGYRNLPGKKITKNEAVNIAKKYTKVSQNAKTKVVENGKGSDFGFYSVSIQDKNGETNMDITKKGGYPIWLINSRDVKEQKISLNDASIKANQFLTERGFKDLELFESTQYDHIGLFNFVTKKNNVRIYPESIMVKVALDDGSIIGFSAEQYLGTNNKHKEIPSAKISEEEARKAINKNVNVMETRLAIINNEVNDEVLCYEFLGTLDNDTYRIYVNAQDGSEEYVEKLQNAEPIYEDVANGKA